MYRAAAAFAGADYSWGMVPYADPGAKLTFAIRHELRRVEREPGLYAAATPCLAEALKSGGYTEKSLLEQPLYPDQMVFLTGTFSMDRDTVEDGQCTADSRTGEVLMRMDEKKARVLAETLAAVVFVTGHIRTAGHPLSAMGEAAKAFIASWESEKYRKSLAGQKAVK